VLRSYASIAYNQPRCQLSAVLAEQALIEAAVPFHLIFDKHLEDLAAYRVVVLPDSECLSDSQIMAIRRFVEGGGGLVIVGASGLYDQWRRARVTPGLAGLVDGQPTAHAYEETVQRHSEEGKELRKEVGRGKVFYLPSFRFNGPLPEFGAYFKVDNRFWRSPANARQFVDGISWARNGEPTAHVEGPNYLIANAVEQPSKRFTAVHLVNYNFHEGPVQNVLVSCRNSKSPRAASVRLYSPDFAGNRELEVTTRGSATAFSVPQVKNYVIAAVEWT
jgi:hypothetical protein